MADLLLLRHGESEWNRLHLYQGQADPPLTDLGEQQALLAVEKLRGIPVVASSDLRRALRTGELLAEALGLDGVVVEPGVRERDTGEWTGLTRPEIERRWPNRADDEFPPGWEDQSSVLVRVQPALHRLADTAPAVVVITHAGVIRAVENHLGQPWAPLANLGGRWLQVEGGTIRPGERVVLIDPDDVRLTVPLET